MAVGDTAGWQPALRPNSDTLLLVLMLGENNGIEGLVRCARGFKKAGIVGATRGVDGLGVDG